MKQGLNSGLFLGLFGAMLLAAGPSLAQQAAESRLPWSVAAAAVGSTSL